MLPRTVAPGEGQYTANVVRGRRLSSQNLSRLACKWPPQSGVSWILGVRMISPEALDFVTRLHREFNPTRERLLARRAERRASIAAGAPLSFLAETADIRKSEWRVAPAPADLDDRRVEITGPAERKMMINALNSGANVFMADMEDALSPTWDNVIEGQASLIEAVRRTLTLETPEGKHYELNPRI